MPDREAAIRSSWDDNAPAWTDAVRRERIESRVRVTNAAVIAAIRRTHATRVLDVGCGEGWLCRALADTGIAATGFDGSSALIAAARDAGGASYELLGYDEFARDPARAGGPYDTVVCNFSLLGEEIAPIMSAAAAVLTEGGALVVQTVHPYAVMGDRYEDGWRTEDFAAMGDGFRSAMPWYYRTLSSWLALVRVAGFDLADCEETVSNESGRPVSLLITAVKPRGQHPEVA